MFKLLISGSRSCTLKDTGRIKECLLKYKKLHMEQLLLIHGDATGVDAWAGYFAEELGIDQIKCPANWKGRGKAAGPIRNKLMVNFLRPDIVEAFPAKDSKGTRHMINYAITKGIQVNINE